MAIKDEDLPGLKTELTTDPAGLRYTGDDVRDEALVNRRDRPAVRQITVEEYRQYLLTQISGTGATQRALVDLIREVSEEGTLRGVPLAGAQAGAQRSAARLLWYVLRYSTPESQFAIESAAVRSMLQLLGPSGAMVFTSEHLQSTAALARILISRAEELYGVGTVITTSDCANARRF